MLYFFFIQIGCKSQQKTIPTQLKTETDESGIKYLKFLADQDTFYVLKEKFDEFKQFVAQDTIGYPQIKMLKSATDRTPIHAIIPNNLHLVTNGKLGSLQFKMCIDHQGNTSAVNLIQADMPINYTELGICIEQLFDFTFEKDLNAPKFECIHKIYAFQKK
ncbi:MAG: hypothetical protein R2774_05795 [Saprospiraceae bacterium]